MRGDSVSTSRRLRAAQVVGAALASVLLLGGCAAGTHPGAAATIGGKEISVSDLDKSTSAIQSAVGDQQQVAPSAVLSLLVSNELAAQVLNQRSISVSDAELGPATKVVVDEALYQKFTGNPSTNDFLIASARALVGRIKLAGGTGITDPNAQQLNSEGAQLLDDAAKKIDVDVSPRYGKWDGSKVDGTSGSLSVLSDQSKPTPTAPQGEQPPAEQPPAEPQG
ncbi:hypothetical protein G3I17_09990 [Streptomyces sp. SID13031]|nr:hypothetical protein [Streptomyces sp. SID13031]